MKKTLLNVLAVGLTSMAFVGGLSAQDYPLSEGATAPRKADRAIQYLSVAGATANEKPVEFKTIIAGEGVNKQDRVYYDNTLNVLDVTKGDKILLSPKAEGWSWMHYYLFVDYNQNKQFEENELVSFAYFTDDNEKTWKDSKGTVLTKDEYNGALPETMPEFAIPEDALKGETRARFICQWNSKDSKGVANIAADRGTICDFTINIHEKGETVVIPTEKVAAPTVTPEAGKYNDQVEVTVSHETEGVTLYYATGGGNPSKFTQVYSDKLTFTENTILKVVAVKEGFKPSDIVTVQYQVRDTSKYQVWDEKNFPRTGTDRVVQKIEIMGATFEDEAVEFTTYVAGEGATEQKKIVFDNTEEEALEATIGDELELRVYSHALEWMHYYVFVDWNKNKEFEESELMTFSSFQMPDGSYVNSKGEKNNGNPTQGISELPLPKFTIPAEAKLGKTRVRFKVDWSSKDPNGTTLAKDRGTMCDFTINIHDENGNDKEMFAVKYTAEEDGGTVALKKEDGTVVATDTEVAEGTKLTLEVTPKEGKTVEKVVVNGKEVTLTDGKVELTISEALDIQVTYGTATAINEVESANVRVYKKAGAILVAGEELGTKVAVYNAQGVLVDSFVITNNPTQGVDLQAGLYLVKVGTKTFKVIL